MTPTKSSKEYYVPYSSGLIKLIRLNNLIVKTMLISNQYTKQNVIIINKISKPPTKSIHLLYEPIEEPLPYFDYNYTTINAYQFVKDLLKQYIETLTLTKSDMEMCNFLYTKMLACSQKRKAGYGKQ